MILLFQIIYSNKGKKKFKHKKFSYTKRNNNIFFSSFFFRFSRSLLTFAAVMTVLIMIVGIIGNLLTIVALLKCPRVRNVAAAFIIR